MRLTELHSNCNILTALPEYTLNKNYSAGYPTRSVGIGCVASVRKHHTSQIPPIPVFGPEQLHEFRYSSLSVGNCGAWMRSRRTAVIINYPSSMSGQAGFAHRSCRIPFRVRRIRCFEKCPLHFYRRGATINVRGLDEGALADAEGPSHRVLDVSRESMKCATVPPLSR